MTAEPRSSLMELLMATLVALISATLFVALHPVVLRFFSTRFIGGSFGDAGLYVWLASSFVDDPATALRFETSAFYPYPLTRAWSDSFLLPSALISLLVSFGVGFAKAYNVTLLGALAANGGASYLLATKVGVRRPYAAACAAVFANTSYFMGNLGHPQLLFFFWIPLALCAVLPSHDSRRAPARRWLMAGICLLGAFYSAVYYAIFIALILALVLLNEVLAGVSSPRRALRVMLLAIVGALPVAFALPAYIAVRGYFGARGLYEAEAFSARGLSYFSHPPLHDFYSATAALSHSEAYLGVGFITLGFTLCYGVIRAFASTVLGTLVLLVGVSLLCGVGSSVDRSMTSEYAVCVGSWITILGALIVVRRVNKTGLGVLLLLTAVFFVFSFGPGGDPGKGEPTFSPLGVLYKRFPGMSAVRAVSRFGSVVILSLYITAALAVERTVARVVGATKSGLLVVVAALFAAVGLLEASVSTVPIDTVSEAPQAIASYRATGHGAALLLPFSGSLQESGEPTWSQFATLHTQYALWSESASGFSMVNGYSGQRSKLQTELSKGLQSFPSSQAFGQIARVCGVTSVIVVPHLYDSWNSSRFDSEIRGYPKEVEQVVRYDDGSILVSLKNPELPLLPERSLTFFGPRIYPVDVTVSNSGDSPCEVRISSVAKDKNTGDVSPIQTQSYLVSGSQKVRVVPPPGLSKASPHIIVVSSVGCQAGVVCSST